MSNVFPLTLSEKRTERDHFLDLGDNKNPLWGILMQILPGGARKETLNNRFIQVRLRALGRLFSSPQAGFCYGITSFAGFFGWLTNQ